MSYNGSGTFQINTSGQPVVAGTVISSTAFNALTADLATGLSTAITKDGQTATTVRIPFAAGISSTLVTDSTSTSTGSIITAGGVGIAKALFVGTTANVAGAATLGSTLTYGGVTLTNAVTGTGKMVLDTSPTLVTPVLGAASATSVTVAAGSAAAPSITTTGDTNTGIFFPAADTIAFSEGGAEAMRIDSSGNVGIGTSSPASGVRLDVQDTAAIARVTSTTGTNAVRYQVANTGGTSQFGRESSGGGTILSGADGYSTVLTGAGAYPMIFGTNSTERMRINSGAPILCLAGGSTTATGTGIAFPATQSASSDANTLDDYEEGTWTPTIGADGVDGTHTYSNQSGTYTKVGRLVTVQCLVALATKGGTISGSVQIIGLPFTSFGTMVETGSVGYFTSLATNVVMLKAYINTSVTRINISKMAAAGANMTQLVAADVSATTNLYVAASYYTT